MKPRMLLVGLIAVAMGTLFAAPAGAQVDPGALAQADVLVDPAVVLGPGEAERLTAAARDLRQAGNPTKFVVLAQRPVNPPQLARDLRQAIGFNGNVLVLSQSPRSLGIGSGLPARSVDEAFTRSVPQLQADPVAGLIAVAQRMAGTSPAGTVSDDEEPAGNRTGGRSAGGGGLFLLGLIAFGFLAMISFTRRLRRQPETDTADERASLEPLVDALAAQVAALDGDLRLGGDRASAAQPYYDEAVLSYGEVREAMTSARHAEPVVLRGTLERGLRAAQAARAVLDGRQPPGPDEAPLLEGLCTFDPKHGRAVRRVKIFTPSGDEASLPVCARCAEGLSRGDLPEVRQVSRHGEAVPYWEAARTVGFGGSLFPMFGGMLGGMLLGNMLGPGVTIIDDGDIGGFGGGDFGGGDFGGGDFGGGGDF